MASATIDARTVNPGDLIIAANVRADTKIDKTFIASIKQHGVLVPINVEDHDGHLEVIDGQRRTLAAIEAGLTEVPVIVRPALAEDAARIIEQLVVNDHRAELDDAEHTQAFHQLALFGVPASQIARKTNLPVKRVETAVNVGASQIAGGAMVEHNLTLDEAAIVLEFEDNSDDVAALTASVKSGRFNHTAGEIRARRDTERLLAAATAELEAEGTPIWDGDIAYSSDRKDAARVVEYLVKQPGAATSLTSKTHADCPHRAAKLSVGYSWDNGNRRVPRVERHEVCTNWKAAGHAERYSSSSSTSVKPEPGSPEAEKATAERRLVRENNKLWLAGTEVRLAYVTELLQRIDVPAGWEQFVADHCAMKYQPVDEKTIARKLLGIADAESFSTWLQAGPRKAPHLLIALCLAWYEGRIDFEKSGWRDAEAKPYLAQLSKWGYTLSELEERVVQGTATKVQPA